MPDENLDKVTRRFYRVGGSRRHPGSGLGLSLVQAVATHQNARLTLTNTRPGLRVSVAFPDPLRKQSGAVAETPSEPSSFQ